MVNNTYNLRITTQRGFSLVEMMVAMLIGIIIMGGILAMYTNTRDAQRSSQDQIGLVSDARFALETMGYDLRHAGVFGGNNLPSTIECRDGGPCTGALPATVGDCVPGWAVDISTPVFAGNNVVPPGYTCIVSHQPNTDVLVVRYADSNTVATGSLVGGTMYVRSNYLAGQIFNGLAQPVIPDDVGSLTNNHQLYSRAYYISTFTNTPGDGIPSLRRVDMVSGPTVQDQLILPGVENFQIQFGEDLDADGTVDQFVNADAVTNFSKVYAARLWVLVRTERTEKDLDTSKNYTIAGQAVAIADDDYRRLLVSSVVKMRNMVRADELTAAGSGS